MREGASKTHRFNAQCIQMLVPDTLQTVSIVFSNVALQTVFLFYAPGFIFIILLTIYDRHVFFSTANGEFLP